MDDLELLRKSRSLFRLAKCFVDGIKSNIETKALASGFIHETDGPLSCKRIYVKRYSSFTCAITFNNTIALITYFEKEYPDTKIFLKVYREIFKNSTSHKIDYMEKRHSNYYPFCIIILHTEGMSLRKDVLSPLLDPPLELGKDLALCFKILAGEE